MKCKHCGVQVFGRLHTCTDGTVYDSEFDAANFLLSAGIAAATDSALLGGLIGGSFLGGAVGDLLDGDLFD